MLENIFIFFTNFTQSFFSVLKVLVRSKFFLSLPEATSDTCYILASGPSLKKAVEMHQEDLKNVTLLTVNNFVSSEYYGVLKPKFHVITDPNLWKEGVSQLKIEQRTKLFDDLIDNAQWPITLFLPVQAYKAKSLASYINKNPNVTFSPFNVTPIEGFQKLNHLFYKWNLGMPRPHNVLIPSIMVAINMKFKKIILLGVDHSWLPTLTVNKDNQVFLAQKHFYDSQEAKKGRMFKDSSSPMRFHDVLYSFMNMFRGYFFLQDYAKKRKADILNATPGSFIDAFERIDLKDVLHT